MRKPNLIDIGSVFDKWTVVGRDRIQEASGQLSHACLCRCACGAEKVIRNSALRSGLSKSCGGPGCQSLVVGERFGRWTVVSLTDPILTPQGIHVGASVCRCDCGSVKTQANSRLRNGDTLSCGCLQRETASVTSIAVHTKHGHSASRETSITYISWASMLTRCTNAKSTKYLDYGGRGITVCERWQSFENFLADMGARPSKSHSIDRFPDTNGNYEPGNCRWATLTQQARNKRNTQMVVYNNVSSSLRDVCDELHLPFLTIRSRLRIGWDLDLAITTPIKPRSQYSTSG